MATAGKKLEMHSEECAKLITEEMGKPIRQSRKEIEKCIWLCEYYAADAEKFLIPEFVTTDASRSYVAFEPLGIIFGIMPWNFPFWQVFRAAVPALMAGNAFLFKHAANVLGCAEAIEKLFSDTGMPPALFRSLIIDHESANKLIEDPRVRGVTLTGSVRAGRAVASKAGEMLKKVVLELGGSDPYIILEDADLEKAAQVCAEARLINTGQSCIAAKRFIVVRPQQRKFEELLIREMKKFKQGDPFDESTGLGPLARLDLRDELHKQVQRSVELGAILISGGYIPAGKGAYYPQTVLINVKKGMPAFDEELFGPVAAVISAENEADAIRLANDSSFGLGAAVFTADPERGERIAKEELEAGACFVNAAVHSDPRLPFGGIKDSGYGRELGVFGIREFVNIKTVYVKDTLNEKSEKLNKGES